MVLIIRNQGLFMCPRQNGNIFSNLAGGAWVAALTLAITPIQINLLGVEAFGLIVKWVIEGAAVA